MPSSPDVRSDSVISQIKAVIEYLNSNLPKNISSTFSGYLIQPLANELRTWWLESSMQTPLNKMGSFDEELEQLKQLARQLDQMNWQGKELLLELVKYVPRLWITRRKDATLATVRRICSNSTGKKSIVERTVAQNNPAANSATGQQEDWDSTWPDENDDIGMSSFESGHESE